MPALRSTRSDWTVEMVRQLPDDGNCYEVVDGELLVSPAPTPRHQRAALLLWKRLDNFFVAHRVGTALSAPADVEFSPRRMVQPDVFALPLINGQIANSPIPVQGLLLAAEVLSPSTARATRHTKRKMYLDERVPEYWIVDVEARLIERWRPGDGRPEICEDHIEWEVGLGAPAFALDLVGYFDEVWNIFGGS